ncbi:cyclic nucleotide-binding protein [Nostoc sp. NIES-4103]|nr:cyclic nucleotide-binding protein [Nostoc sp. NIES-4103]
MLATIEEIAIIPIFSNLKLEELEQLQPHTEVREYLHEEIIFHEGDYIAAQLYTVLSGKIQVKKTAATGKETILRVLPAGEIFGAPALFDDPPVAPATVIAEQNCQILTVKRTALLSAIQQTPEIALRILHVLNQRLQELQNTVHGLISERAIVRLAKLILYNSLQYGTEPVKEGQYLKVKLPYYEMSRKVGITYEECVRLIKSLASVVDYRRGGKITILDVEALNAIASGEG